MHVLWRHRTSPFGVWVLFTAFSTHYILVQYRSLWRTSGSRVDMSQDSVFVLANVRAMRREAILSHLPSIFKNASKVDLRQSSIHSSFLFEENKVKDALKLSEKSAYISFQQAAARALVKPRPVPGTPLVEQGLRASTSGVFPQRAFPSSRRQTSRLSGGQHKGRDPSFFLVASSSSGKTTSKFFRK